MLSSELLLLSLLVDDSGFAGFGCFRRWISHHHQVSSISLISINLIIIKYQAYL